MFRQYQTLTIQGTTYEGKALQDHSLQQLNDPASPGWEKEMYQFIGQWLDENDSISLQTSGSTGTPKIVDYSKDKMVTSARMTADHFHLAADSTALLCLSAGYIAGKMMIVRALVNGWNLIPVAPSQNPLAGFPEKQVIDFAALVPMQLQTIISGSRQGLAQINKIIVGGAPVNAALQSQLQNIPCEVYETFGMTETVSHIAVRKISGAAPQTHFETIDNIKVSTDAGGCLLIHAPQYADEPIITNDIVELQDERHFRWLGRADNVVNSGGVKLFPESIEAKIALLIDTPYFLAGEADDKLGQRLVLFIESGDARPEELAILESSLREFLSPFEVPKQVYFLSEFEYTGSGKIQRNATQGKYLNQ